MAKTAYTASSAETKKLWEEKLFRDTVKEAYFSKFFGTTSDSLVQVQENLTKSQGDAITFGIRMRLAGAGVTSGTALEGNEEKLSTYTYQLLLEEYAHAVRDKGPLDRQRAFFSIDEESQNALMDWGSEKIDQLLFDSIQAAPTKIFYGGAATSTATLTATDKLTPELISKVKTWVKTGGARSQTPLRPIKVAGGNYYVLLVHPDAMFDLKRNAEFQQAMREAQDRGSENPLFRNAVAIWDGVVIHEHENINLYTTWGAGANVAGASCAFMGAQSLLWAWGKRPTVVAEDFDYGREHGYAWSFMGKAGKPKFNSKDYGSVGVYVARTNVSGS